MILKGNQRGGGRQMALHLLNGMENEHVTVHEVRGFMADDVLGALNEAHSLSKGTKCKQYMYSLSLNPPEQARVPIEVFEKTLERIEKKLGLSEQPRVLVFHEKEGRRHAHCVWSRIDVENMKAINISHDRRKLQSIGKSLFLEQGWDLPSGFRDQSKSNPLNFTREEWEQAKRIGRRPDDIKREMQECWSISDDRASFKTAMQEYGYFVAKGDKRGFVALDIHGQVYSLTRQLGLKKIDVAKRLGPPERLPTVADIKLEISGRLKGLFSKFADELNLKHKTEKQPFMQRRKTLTEKHRIERTVLKEQQEERWMQEEIKRSHRVRKGFKGLWDKISGRYWKVRKLNEQETMKCFRRDKLELENLVSKQLTERQGLQEQIIEVRDKHELERQELVREMSHLKDLPRSSEQGKGLERDHAPFGKGRGPEPELH